MDGSNDGSPIVKRAPEIGIGNLIVEGGLERREGAVDGIEDDLLAEFGEDAFFSDDELYSILLAYAVSKISQPSLIPVSKKVCMLQGVTDSCTNDNTISFYNRYSLAHCNSSYV